MFFRSVIKPLLVIAFISLSTVATSTAQTADQGRAIFKANCTACHALNAKVVGPALSGVTDRHDAEWLRKWIKNSQAMIAAGDPAAVKLFNENDKKVMTAFPTLSDADIDGILAYVKEGEKAPAAAAGGAGAGVAKEEGVSNFMLLGLVGVIVIAFLVIILLNRIIKSLERVVLKNQGIVLEEAVPADRGASFRKLAKNKKFVFFTILVLVAILGTAGWIGMWNTGVHTGYQPVQPIKFSHQLHAGINKIDCRYCHSGAYKSRNASIPSLNVCMNCHNYVTASAKYNGQTSPEIMKIYKALDYNPDTREYGNNQKPIEWVRIHNLPDLAYFNHSQHVSVAGVKCQKCHGPVQTMEELYQASPLTMKWCINCHKATEVNSKGNAYYDRLIAAHERLKKGEKMTAAVFGGLECGKCHY